MAADPITAPAPAIPARPAPPQTAVQRVHALVRERVLSGEYDEGLMLSENGVATELGVSRTPVREAFVQLESQGFLRLYPKRGALVVPVTREEVDAVLETRWAVERHALEEAIRRGDAATLDAMQSVIEAQAERLAAGDLAAFSDLDREFHRAAVAATGNTILVPLYDSLRDRQRRLVRGMLLGDRARAESVLAEHEAILAAMRAGKTKRTVDLLRTHLATTRHRYGGAPAG